MSFATIARNALSALATKLVAAHLEDAARADEMLNRKRELSASHKARIAAATQDVILACRDSLMTRLALVPDEKVEALGAHFGQQVQTFLELAGPEGYKTVAHGALRALEVMGLDLIAQNIAFYAFEPEGKLHGYTVCSTWGDARSTAKAFEGKGWTPIMRRIGAYTAVYAFHIEHAKA